MNDFSLLTVYSHSSSSVPLAYKISGLWASSEGSLLLFVWTLSLYNTLYLYSYSNTLTHKKITLEIQSAICAIFILFVILVANPFQVNKQPATEGLGLNPLLQDIALIIHPPILYIGYVGFSIIFSIAVAYCYKPDKCNIGKMLKPWILLAWSVLTFGVGLGSWWAYRELGWGGLWFWDPVENISLMPWILGLALLHAVLLVEKYNALERWVVFLAIITFIVSIVGTFLIRSGVLNSVHAFAGNTEQISYMLILMSVVSIGGIASYIIFCKCNQSKSQRNILFLSHEHSILLGNWFLVISAVAILAGVLYPLFVEYFKSYSIVIPASYYNSTLQKILLPFLLIWIIGPQLIVRKNIIKNNILSLGISLAILPFFYIDNVIALFLLFLSIWLFFSMLISYVNKICLFISPISESLKLIISTTKSYYAMFFAHIGGAMLVFAIICNSHFSSEQEKYMQIGETLEVSRYSLKLEKIAVEEQNNYKALKAIFYVNNSFYLTPEIRFYTVEGQSTAETAIHHDFLSDLYVVMSEIDEELGLGVQVHYNRLINLIWASVILISIGGLLGVSGRK